MGDAGVPCHEVAENKLVSIVVIRTSRGSVFSWERGSYDEGNVAKQGHNGSWQHEVGNGCVS